MARADMIIATGGQAMVSAAHSSGTPAYGVGAGNSTMIIDKTANIEEAAHNTRLSKTSDFGSGCSADGNLIIEASIFDKLLEQLKKEGGYLANDQEKAQLRRVMWTTTAPDGGHGGDRAPAAREGGGLHDPCRSQVHHGARGWHRQGAQLLRREAHHAACPLQIHRFRPGVGDDARHLRSRWQDSVLQNSLSFDLAHVHQPCDRGTMSPDHGCQAAPSRRPSASTFDDGEVPMTSSLGCGTWGGNIVSENVHLKHYMNTTWVSVPIKEDKPSDEELFGTFYDPAMEAEVEFITT